ncbi:MAG: histidine kinase dimerization/phosphoacceptor domain -containing protein [Planctomycetota bacterium]|jgi:PAS domain S-box-containing protein
MNHQDKTKEQLISELKDMRQRNTEASTAEHQSLEAKLLESEGLYKMTTENSVSPSYFFHHGKLAFFNEVFIPLSGYTKEQLMSMNYLQDSEGKIVPDLVMTADITEAQRIEDELSQYYQHLEALVSKRTAELKQVNQQLKREITERQQAEKQLCHARREWKDIFQAIGHPTLILDSQHNVIAANRATMRATGMSEAELKGKKCYQLLHGSEQCPPSCPMQKMIQSGHLETVDMEMEALGGTFLVSCTPVFDDAGQLEKIIHIATDITERKRAEEQVLRQNALLDAINQVFRETLTCETDEEVAQMCISVAEELTSSKCGFIGEINDFGRVDNLVLSNSAWDECRIPKSDAVAMIRDMEIRGIWGKVLQDETSLLVNQPNLHPDSVGIPTGHPTIKSFMGVPLTNADSTIGIIALANKDSGYDLTDKQVIEVLSVAFVEALNRKRAEAKIKASLKEKELLLREIHHRVKNNLTVISSLFSMSSRRTDNSEVIDLLREAQGKIYTMGLIHSQLYESDSFDAVNMEEHIRRLVAHLSQMYDVGDKRITSVIAHSDVTLSLTQAIPCALVLNELISNVFKHAFQEREEGTLEIAMKQSSDGSVTIRVKDDGIGIPQQIDLDTIDSLGFKLVRNIVQMQLKGTMQIQRHQGTEVTVEFNINQEWA